MAREATALPLGVTAAPPERMRGRWVVDALRIAIREGRLRPGDRMPGSRDLAVQWGISRGLISAAYEELQVEGMLTSRTGSGTYVSAPADPALASQSAPELVGEATLADHPSWDRVNPGKPFIARETDPSKFPIETWKRLTHRVLSEADPRFFLDPDPAGHAALREQVARYLGFARGITCEPGDILITTGIRHGLDLCLRCLLRAGEAVWAEDPGYGGAEDLLRLHGLVAVPVPIDMQGMRVEHAEALAPDARLCLVTPSHQSPLGVRLSFERRRALLAWAERKDAYVFEDDYDGEFAFDAVRFPAFKAMDASDRVIHAGSFNKVLFPTLRVGYLVMPRALNHRLRRVRECTGRSNSATEQRVLAGFLSEGHFARHIRRMGAIYQEKCLLASRSIASAYGEALDLCGTQCGFHFFLVLPDGTNVGRLLDEARVQGLSLQCRQLLGKHGSRSGLIIGYSSLPLDVIEVYGNRLGRLLRSCRI